MSPARAMHFYVILAAFFALAFLAGWKAGRAWHTRLTPPPPTPQQRALCADLQRLRRHTVAATIDRAFHAGLSLGGDPRRNHPPHPAPQPTHG